MKIKLLVGALVLLMVVNIAAIAAFLVVQTHHPRHFARWRHSIHGRPFAKLDREKRQALSDAMKQFHEEARDVIEETHALENEAIAAMGESPVPRARIDSLLERISDNRLEIARRATNRMIEMGERLTPKERERLMAGLMRMRGPRIGAPAHEDRESPPEK